MCACMCVCLCQLWGGHPSWELGMILELHLTFVLQNKTSGLLEKPCFPLTALACASCFVGWNQH